LTWLTKINNVMPITRPAGKDEDGNVLWESETLISQTLPMMSCLHQDSPQIIHMIRSDYMDYPDYSTPYNLSDSESQDQKTRDLRLLNKVPYEVDDLIFKGQKKGGFFVEAGGHNFEDGSTSLHFELKHNWTGLIVEPYESFYTTGMWKNRKVYSSMSCLSREPRPTVLKYNVERQEASTTDGQYVVQCLPLYSLLQALDNPTVNYMSLDIEGGEFQVLQSLPWDKVDIEVMSIESHFLGKRSAGTLDDLIKYLGDRGYIHVKGAHKSRRKSDSEKMEAYDENLNVIQFDDGIEYIVDQLFVRKDIAEASGIKEVLE